MESEDRFDEPGGESRSRMRAALVVVDATAAARRLLDVIELVESDPNVRVFFNAKPGPMTGEVEAFLTDVGARTVPWSTARRSRFDLLLSTEAEAVADLRGPAIVVPYGLMQREPLGEGRGIDAPVGKVVSATVHNRPSATPLLALAHEWPRILGDRSGVAPNSLVAGDPTYDRLTASLPARSAYRAKLGVREDQTLVLLCSGSHPLWLFDGRGSMVRALVDDLPTAEYRVMCLLPYRTWREYGSRQVRAWVTGVTGGRVTLIEPRIDWRAALVAADQVVGDSGPVTGYAASIGKPVLLVRLPGSEIPSGSMAEAVAAATGVLDPGRSLRRQVADAGTPLPTDVAEVVSRLTSLPGRSAYVLRTSMYQLLRLPEPQTVSWYRPVPVPPSE